MPPLKKQVALIDGRFAIVYHYGPLVEGNTAPFQGRRLAVQVRYGSPNSPLVEVV